MKKFIFMLIAMFMLAIGTINAQEQSNYAGSSKFTDNWSVTLQGGVLTSFDNFYSGHTAMAPIVVVGINKEINPWLGVSIEGRTLIGTGNGMYNTKTAFDWVNVSGNLRFNVLNMVNYNGERKFFEPIVYTGLGWGHRTCSVYEWGECIEEAVPGVTRASSTTVSTDNTDMMKRNYLTYRAGVELNFNLGKEKEWSVVVNPSVVWGNGETHEFPNLCKHAGSFEVTAGFVYRFKTSNGKRSIVRPRLYDAAEVAALNERIKELESRPAVIKEVVKEMPVTTTNVVEKTYVVTFAQNSSTLTEDAKTTLDKVSGSVSIVASASPEGTAEYNKALSDRRAAAVAEYLKSKGVQVSNATGVGVMNDASNRIAIVTVE